METFAFWVGLIAYALATVTVSAGFAFGKERWTAVGYWIAVGGFAAETISILVRMAQTCVFFTSLPD
ncbi:MAG: hypothetical protein FDZ75_06070, partial [Actinobacteria bacterium]